MYQRNKTMSSADIKEAPAPIKSNPSAESLKLVTERNHFRDRYSLVITKGRKKREKYSEDGALKAGKREQNAQSDEGKKSLTHLSKNVTSEA